MDNLLLHLGAAISFYLAFITGTGKILQYVNFQDPLNEMVFFILMIMIGLGLVFSGKTTKNCS